MKYMVVRLLTISIFVCLPMLSWGQSIIDALSSSGASSSDGNIVVNWTVGHLVNGSSEVDGLQVSNVLYQPRYVVTSLEPKAFSSKIKVYPNPSTDYITINSFGQPIASIKLYDNTGQLILDVPDIQQRDLQILELSDIKDGIYSLILITNETPLKQTFRIIKTSGK